MPKWENGKIHLRMRKNWSLEQYISKRQQERKHEERTLKRREINKDTTEFIFGQIKWYHFELTINGDSLKRKEKQNK